MKFSELLHQMIESHGFGEEVAADAHEAVDDFVGRFGALFEPTADDQKAVDVSRETSVTGDDPKGAGNGAQ